MVFLHGRIGAVVVIDLGGTNWLSSNARAPEAHTILKGINSVNHVHSSFHSGIPHFTAVRPGFRFLDAIALATVQEQNE